MRYLSLFSGIEAASAAWAPLGWECVAVAEVEPFPCAVLAHHHPGVPNLGDVTKITETQVQALGHIDVVVFGSPCQDLSVAGQRKGLINEHGDITRSGLFFTAINIFHWSGARFALWENVPGAFSSGKGRDFASVVSFMAGLDDVDVPPNGWGTEGAALGDNGLLEWGTLDAPKNGGMRGRRVFAILDVGDWAGRPPILLERKATTELRGEDTRIPRIDASGLAKRQTMPEKSRCWTIHDGFGHRFLMPEEVEELFGFPRGYTDVRNNLQQMSYPNSSRDDGPAEVWEERLSQLVQELPERKEKGDAKKRREPTCAFSLDEVPASAGGFQCFAEKAGRPLRDLPASDGTTLRGPRSRDRGCSRDSLPPMQCETPRARSMGLPRQCNPLFEKPMTPDGPRYKALGNSMAVPVMRHIGIKIMEAVWHI